MKAPRGSKRTRACRACDRCRLKKAKCDDANPCTRCRADNALCKVGVRGKAKDRAYPKGYVEMLERQQGQLVAGLRELYSRLHLGRGWPGQPLRREHGRHPLTHDILERLELLHATGEHGTDGKSFEADFERVQQKRLEERASGTLGQGFAAPDSDHGHSVGPSLRSGIPMLSIESRDLFVQTPLSSASPVHIPFQAESQMIQQPVGQGVPTPPPAFVRTEALDSSVSSQSGREGDSWKMDVPAGFASAPFMFDP